MADRLLDALEAVDFSWTVHVSSIWSAPEFDIDQLHQQARSQIVTAAQQLARSPQTRSPLGKAILGPPGAGKTHLLAATRHQLQSLGIGFVLVDMTDVKDFWGTVLQGFINSLREDSESGVPQAQLRQLIKHLIDLAGYQQVSAEQMAGLKDEALRKGLAAILRALNKDHAREVSRFQDVIRAIVLLNSDDFGLADVGYSWLSGLEIEAEDRRTFRFKSACQTNLVEIVEGLSWLMSLQAPWVVAFDQLDAIVSQHHYATQAAAQAASQALPDAAGTLERQLSKAIIEGIGGGLMALRDKTARTLTVVSCLDVTWQILTREVVQSFKDRFESPTPLMPVVRQDVAAQLVESRLQAAYRQHRVDPPYPTWPFHPDFFADAAQRGKLPRQILQRCDQHRQHCASQQAITELTAFSPVGPAPIGPADDFTPVVAAFETARQQVDVIAAIAEGAEDSLWSQWLPSLAHCLLQENPLPEAIDAAVDAGFARGRSPQLHARLRLIYREQGDREQHLCLRALLRANHTAYRNRLNGSMSAAGIDRGLQFRRLLVFRLSPPPGGKMTQALTQKFLSAGGVFIAPTKDDLRTIAALHQLTQHRLPKFDRWLQQARPASQLGWLKESVTWLFGRSPSPTPSLATPAQPSPATRPAQNGRHRDRQIVLDMDAAQAAAAPAPPTLPPSPPAAPRPQPAPVPPGHLPVGRRVGPSTQPVSPVSIPLEALKKHTVILAGSGAGKTVLVRRLIEEAALQGVPAIVIDGANDLARLGDAWPQAPEVWSAADQEKAEQYHRSVDVTVWTPGREAGNPVNLKPLPEFAALVTNRDELDQAVDMACDSLQDGVAPGKGAKDQIKRGLLRSALAHFARSGGGELETFVEFLRDLPEAATGNISKADKLGPEMADLLSAAIASNPLLRQRGTPLDPAVLLGLGQPKTRISVLNFIGLPGLPQQQQFLNQLAMTLFTWIKKNPAPAGVPLRGLLVIDEAKDFLPSQQTTPCKSSLNRLAAQARKYGLGLIFATQAPKSIDHNIIANCSTQFYGRANSPSAIAVVQDQLRQRGGDGFDIAKLGRGQFYAVSESLTPPVKLLTPLCLSYHPPSPLDESEVLKRARRK